MDELRHEVATLKEDHVDPMPPKRRWTLGMTLLAAEAPPSQSPLELILAYSAFRVLVGKRKMEILQLQGDEDFYRSVRMKTPPPSIRVVKVTPATEALLSNNDRADQRSIYALPKVAMTKVPTLNRMMTAHCLKNTKSNDWRLSRIQSLTLAHLMNIQELFNSPNLKKPLDQVAKAVESAISLLGIASCHISSLA